MFEGTYQRTIEGWLYEAKDMTRRLAKLTATARTIKNAVTDDDFVETEKHAVEKLLEVAKAATEKCAEVHRLLMHMEEDIENFQKAKLLSILPESGCFESEMVAVTGHASDPMICDTEESFVRHVALSSLAANASPSRSISRASYPY